MRGRSLNGADLRDANLGGANLSFARLSASNLAGATVRWNSQNTQAKLGSLTSLPGWVRGTGRKVGVDVFEAACRRQVVVGDWDAFRGRVVDGGGAGEKADFAVFEDGEGDVGCRMFRLRSTQVWVPGRPRCVCKWRGRGTHIALWRRMGRCRRIGRRRGSAIGRSCGFL